MFPCSESRSFVRPSVRPSVTLFFCFTLDLIFFCFFFTFLQTPTAEALLRREAFCGFLLFFSCVVYCVVVQEVKKVSS